MSIRLNDLTKMQLDELTKRFNATQAAIVSTAIDRMYREEINMTTKFTYKGYDVEITEQLGGYGFEATDADGSGLSFPNPALQTPAYQTIGIATAEVKRRITRYLNDMSFEGNE